MKTNDLLEKAKRDYPIGTKFKDVFDGKQYIIENPVFLHYGNIYATNDDFKFICIYHAACNKWAKIITMTQEEFNDLKVGDFINNYEILHKYNEFLIVRCNDGHDLFDLAKINKLGLKIQPKTFMGLEVKDYDNAPCEINEGVLFYLAEVRIDDILIRTFKDSPINYYVPTSIRLL